MLLCWLDTYFEVVRYSLYIWEKHYVYPTNSMERSVKGTLFISLSQSTNPQSYTSYKLSGRSSNDTRL